MTEPDALAQNLQVLAVWIPGRPLRANVASRGARQAHTGGTSAARGAAHVLALSALRSRPHLRSLARAPSLRAVVFETYVDGAAHADVAAAAPSAKAAVDGIVAALDGIEPTRSPVRDDETRIPEVTFRAGLVTGAAGLLVALERFTLATPSDLYLQCAPEAQPLRVARR